MSKEADELLKDRSTIGDYTQSEYADRFTEEYGDRFRYIPPEDRWLNYSDGRWREDQYDAAFHFAEKMCRQILEDTPKMSSSGTKTNPYREVARSRCSAASIAAVCRIARTKRPIVTTRDKFDANPYLLNTPNGTYDLLTGEILPHDSKHMITHITSGVYSPDIEAPEDFTEYFDEVQTLEWQEQLWRAVGCSLLGVFGEYAFLHTGSGGNGKSTFLDLVGEALGDYADEASWKVLHKIGEEAHETILEDLRGKRVSIIHMGSRSLSPEQLRLLVSESTVKARGMRENMHTFRASHTFHVSMNNPPPMNDLDASVRRRLLIVPWNVTVREPDPMLKERLRITAKDYVLTQLIDGYQRWSLAQFPRDPTEAQFSKNPIYAFGTTCCEFDPTYSELTENLYAAAQRWAEDTGEKLPSPAIFGRTLSRTFNLSSYRTSGSPRRKGWSGIRLITDYHV